MSNEQRTRQKIESVEGLRGVIHAMRSLAATYLRRAESRREGIRAYEETLGSSIADCLAGRDVALPQSAPGRTAVMVFFSEQGLCGRFNDLMAEAAAKQQQSLEQPSWLVIGRRGGPLLQRYGLSADSVHSSISNPEDIDAMVHTIASGFLRGHEREGYNSTVHEDFHPGLRVSE